MKKSFGIYSIIWALSLGIFNTFTFVTPSELAGYSKFTGVFWVGYIFITVAFVGQLICAAFAFSSRNIGKFFYKLPLISISYSSLVAIVIVGSIFMALPFFSVWFGVVICVLAFGLNLIAVIKAGSVTGIVNGIDERVHTQTFYIKNLITLASELVAIAQDSRVKEVAEKVYEELRFSDPVSADSLVDIEVRIHRQFKIFGEAVKADDLELSNTSANELIILIKCRNEKCKLLKP